jgi:hypothetical protein
LVLHHLLFGHVRLPDCHEGVAAARRPPVL